MVFVLISVLFVALRDLVTRGLPTIVPSTIVSFQAYVAVALSGGFLILIGQSDIQPMESGQMKFILASITFGVVGYYGLVSAMRIGEAAVVTPFRYSRLIFSLIVGFVVFHERPDMWTLVGATIVIATGLFTVWREQVLARQ